MGEAKNLAVQLNGDYEESTKYGYTYVEGALVLQPLSQPKFTLSEFRNAISPYCFQRSMFKSFGYLALDLVIVSALLCCGYILLEQQSFPLYWQLVGYSIYWFLEGSFLTGLWVIAHECEFSESDFVNDLVGSIRYYWYHTIIGK